MKLRVVIPYNGSDHVWPLLPCDSKFQVINLPDVVHFEIYKSHNHSYSFTAFFYVRKRIIWPRNYSSKKELFGAIQKLLQEEL